MPEEPLPRMKSHLITGQELLREILTDLRKDVQSVIRDMADDKKSLTKKGRNKHYKELEKLYMGKAVADLSDYAGDLALAVASDTAEATALAAGLKASESIKVSGEWIKDVYTKTFGTNIEDYVAVRTKKMLDTDRRALEQAVTSTLREQSVKSFSAQDALVSMQSRVGAYADNPTTWAFIDKAGKKWDTGNYFAMLNRTLTKNFTDEAVRDQAIENKPEEHKDVYYTAQTAGDPCPLCSAWAGVVVTESGNDTRFPTVSDLYSAGWGHPNCVCSLVVISPDLDDDIIEAQAPIKRPPPKPTKEEWREYRSDVLAKVPERTRFNKHSPALDQPTQKQRKRVEKEAEDSRKA